MTEYDYSPDAWERYIETQHRIARWVDGTLTQAPCNAFAPATPHIKFLELERKDKKKSESRKEPPPRERRHSYDVRDHKYRSDTEEEDNIKSSSRSNRHRKRQSNSSHVTGETSRHHDRSSSSRPEYSSSRDRESFRSERRSSLQTARPCDKEKPIFMGEGYVVVEKEKSRTTQNTPTSTRVSTPTSATRPRSSSQSVTRIREPVRSQTAPALSLDLPPLGQPHDPYYYRYPRLSAGGSRPSSGSTTNGVLLPQLTQTPKSAPAVTRYHAPQPVRSHTVPLNPGYGYTPSSSPDPAKVPQLPYSAYTSSPTKANNSTSLLKRMFTGLAIHRQSPSPKPKYSSKAKDSYAMHSENRRILRKRSSSF